MSPQTPKQPTSPKPSGGRPPVGTPTGKPTVDRHLAKDVAKHIDRRQMRRKLLLWALLVGAIVLAALFLTCGRGFGLGGKGKGEGKGEGSGPGSAQPLLSPPEDAGPRRCAIRIAANGISADGKAVTVEEAVAACKGAASAEVIVTGGARVADWEDLKTAFEKAGIRIFRAEPKSEGSAAGGAEPAPAPAPAAPAPAPAAPAPAPAPAGTP